MPLYEYYCKTCNQTFEKMTRWSESDRSPVCPHCHSADTQKKISSFASLGGSQPSSSGSSCGSSGRFS